MDKEDVVYTHNGTILRHKKDEILSSATTWADIEGIMPREISHIEKDNYHMISLIHEV